MHDKEKNQTDLGLVQMAQIFALEPPGEIDRG